MHVHVLVSDVDQNLNSFDVRDLSEAQLLFDFEKGEILIVHKIKYFDLFVEAFQYVFANFEAQFRQIRLLIDVHYL